MVWKSATEPSTFPSVCIFGGGAVGQYLAVQLARAGAPVSVVCRGSTYHEIRELGKLVVQDVPRAEEFVTSNFKLINSAQIGEVRPVDVVLSCAKAHHLPAALPVLRQLVGPNTVLATIQNGLPFHHGHMTSHKALEGRPLTAVDPDGALLAAFTREQVVAGVAYIAAERTGPGRVTCRSTPKITRFLFGEVAGGPGKQAAALQGVVDALHSQGVLSSVEPDILSVVWRKLLHSACINPTNALTHGHVDALVRSKRMAEACVATAREVMAVGIAVGAEFQMTAEEWLEACQQRFPPCKFSMLQDVEAGRELEVGALVLAILDIAQQIDVPTPRLDTVGALIEHYNDNIMGSTVDDAAGSRC